MQVKLRLSSHCTDLVSAPFQDFPKNGGAFPTKEVWLHLQEKKKQNLKSYSTHQLAQWVAAYSLINYFYFNMLGGKTIFTFSLQSRPGILIWIVTTVRTKQYIHICNFHMKKEMKISTFVRILEEIFSSIIILISFAVICNYFICSYFYRILTY